MEKKRVLYILVFLFGANVILWLTVFYFNQSKFLEVTFFDVGQGDSIFIETPQKNQILIDGGPSSLVLEKLGTEMPFWDRTIDFIILTHPDHDHISGLIEVLKSYKIKNILWTGVLKEDEEYREWIKLIKEEGANVYIAREGQRIIEGDMNLEVLFPFNSLEGQKSANCNNTSIVSRLTFGDNSFLFLGDIYKAIEKEILASGQNIDSDVLKTAHHGSKTSSSEEFIKQVSPDIALISCGKDNSYGHPHQETLEILGKYGIDILRTDLNGDINLKVSQKELILN